MKMVHNNMYFKITVRTTYEKSIVLNSQGFYKNQLYKITKKG